MVYGVEGYTVEPTLTSIRGRGEGSAGNVFSLAVTRNGVLWTMKEPTNNGLHDGMQTWPRTGEADDFASCEIRSDIQVAGCCLIKAERGFLREAPKWSHMAPDSPIYGPIGHQMVPG